MWAPAGLLLAGALGISLPLAVIAGGAGSAASSAGATGQLAVSPTLPALSDPVARALGKRIWQNEAAGSVEGLTRWNRGEEFASLGIGHFIWYPKDTPKTFQESFPALVAFLRERGAEPPPWLMAADGFCPWASRDEFLGDFDSPRMRELRAYLQQTIAGQSQFIAHRLQTSLGKILASVPASAGKVLEQRFRALYATEKGLYALIDYVNFKGEGINPNERYQGRGWGLRQALSGMEAESGKDPVAAFADSAEASLRQRVALSPPERNEQRWLAGWMKRIESYRR